MGATGYFTHPDCLKHEMGAGHPECPERLSAIEDRLLISGVDMALTRREAPPAALADIELAHGRMHVAALRGLTDSLREYTLTALGRAAKKLPSGVVAAAVALGEAEARRPDREPLGNAAVALFEAPVGLAHDLELVREDTV